MAAELNLSEEELERLAILALGFIAGVVLVGLALSLIEEWVIESDLADRRRIREILREMLDAGDPAAGSSTTPIRALSLRPGVKEDTPASSSIPVLYPETTPH